MSDLMIAKMDLDKLYLAGEMTQAEYRDASQNLDEAFAATPLPMVATRYPLRGALDR